MNAVQWFAALSLARIDSGILRVLLSDTAGGNGAALLGALGPGCRLTEVSGPLAARRDLERCQFDLIVIDPRAGGELANIALLDTLPANNAATAVLLLCGAAPGDECADRANAVLLKDAATPQALAQLVLRLIGRAPRLDA